ncbi:MAG: HDOD domain-containing protein [Planctomycetota bacterium]|nr:MAG: HDOD domain-containing protein [Planctomycetota bacterium]
MGLFQWLFKRLSEPRAADRANTAETAAPPEATVAVADPPGSAVEEEVGETWWSPRGATLTELVEPDRPELSPDARALENLLVSHFDGHDLSLPPLLSAAERVLPILARKDYDVREVADALAEDQVVAAAVLRMANSPLYRGVNKITTLPPAISRLGTRALRMLLLHESMRSAMFHTRSELHNQAQAIWQRAIASAAVMRGLAAFTGLDRDQAFLAGLLHDIGYVVVLRITHEYAEAARFDIDIDEQTFEYLCYETHQEFGELIGTAWSMPEPIQRIVADHHTYPDQNDPERLMKIQLHLSDMIVSLLGYAPYAPYDLLESRPVSDLDLAQKAKFIVYLQQLPEQVDELIGSL